MKASGIPYGLCRSLKAHADQHGYNLVILKNDTNNPTVMFAKKSRIIDPIFAIFGAIKDFF